MSSPRTAANSQLTEKTLDVLEAVAALGATSLPDIQTRCGLPATTAHRIIQSLVARQFLLRTGKGDYRLGSAAIALTSGLSYRALLAPAARMLLQTLSRHTQSHVHLGIWQDGMVEYLVKQSYGKTRLHSAEGTQLEGYCSALGKVLLAHLPDEQVGAYLADGPFVRLTPHTVIDPHLLQRELIAVRACGWASDNAEAAPGLRCVAVPVQGRSGHVLAAVSISTTGGRGAAIDPAMFLPLLQDTAAAITHRLFG